MILHVFSIRDAAAEFFNPPFFARSHGEAERNFQALAKEPKSTVFAHPEHFDLYYLGRFDDQSGKMELLVSPEHVMKAIQIQKQHTALKSLPVENATEDRM